MDSARWLLDFLTSPATPLYGIWLTVGVMAWRASVAGFPAIIMAFIERRKALFAEKEAEFNRLRAEVQRLAAEAEQCHRDLAAEREARHEAVSSLRDELATEKAERVRQQAITNASGDIRNAKAAAQAEVRADPAKAPTTMERFSGEKDKRDEEGGAS